MKLKNTQLSQIWNHLGDFWGRFEDKDTVENWWESAMSVLNTMYKTSYWVGYSKSIRYLPPIISGVDFYFPIYYGDTIPSMSGILNINVSGEYNPGVGAIIGIDQLTNIYYVDEDNPFTEVIIASGTNYDMSADREYLTFVDHETDLEPNANQSNINYCMLYASGTSIVNPFLFNYWGRLVGVDINNYLNENYSSYLSSIDGIACSEAQKYLYYYKYFIWAMLHLRKKAYTLDVIENLIGISYGLPFAFESGIVTSVAANGADTDIAISGEIGSVVYTIPDVVDSYISVVADEAVDTFQLLVSGFELDDYVSDPTLVDYYADSGISRYSTTVLTIPEGLSGIAQNEVFSSGLMDDILPEGVRLFYYSPLTILIGILEAEAALTFDALYSGQTTNEKALYISSLAGSSITDLEYTFSNEEFTNNTAIPTTLAASGEIVVPVVFTPSNTAGYNSSDLTVAYDMLGTSYSNTFTNIVTGSGIVPPTTGAVFVATDGDDQTGDGAIGTPYQSINTGLVNVSPGDTLYIREGVYAEQLRECIPSGYISWESGLTVQAYPSERVEIMPDSYPPGAPDSSSNQFYGILCDTDRRYLKFVDLIFNASGTVNFGRASTNQGTADNIIYSGCTFIGQPGAVDDCAVVSAYSQNMEFVDCEIMSGNSHGIYLAGSRTEGYSFSSGLIDNCKIQDVVKYGIHFNNEDVAGTEHTVTMNDNIIRNNRIYNCSAYAGIILAGARRAQVYNNLIYDNNYGIYLTYCRNYDCEIYNNTIVNSIFGIRFDNYRTNNAKITNNIIANSLSKSLYETNISGVLDATITYNLLEDTVDLPSIELDSTNVIGEDPQFVDATNKIFTLNPNSPAVDIGTDVSHVRTSDYYGRVPKGDGYDAGAFEFEAASDLVLVPTYYMTVDTTAPLSETNYFTASGAFRAVDEQYANIVGSGAQAITITFGKEDFTGEDNLNEIDLPSGGAIPITIQGTGAEIGNRTRFTAKTTFSGIEAYYDDNYAGWREYMGTGYVWDWDRYINSGTDSSDHFSPMSDDVVKMPYFELSGAYRYEFVNSGIEYEEFDGYVIYFFPDHVQRSARVDAPLVTDTATGRVFDEIYKPQTRLDSGLAFPNIQYPFSHYLFLHDNQEVTPWMFTPLEDGVTRKLILFDNGQDSTAVINPPGYALSTAVRYWEGQYIKIATGLSLDDYYTPAWNGVGAAGDRKYRFNWIFPTNAKNVAVENIDFDGTQSLTFYDIHARGHYDYAATGLDTAATCPGDGYGDTYGALRLPYDRVNADEDYTFVSVEVPSGITLSNIAVTSSRCAMTGWANELTIEDCVFSGVTNRALHLGATGPLTARTYDPSIARRLYEHDSLAGLTINNTDFWGVWHDSIRLATYSGVTISGINMHGMMESLDYKYSSNSQHGGFYSSKVNDMAIRESYFETDCETNGCNIVFSGNTVTRNVPEATAILYWEIVGMGMHGDYYGDPTGGYRINSNILYDDNSIIDLVGDFLFEGTVTLESRYLDGAAIPINLSGLSFINNYIQGKAWNINMPFDSGEPKRPDIGNPTIWFDEVHDITFSGNTVVGGDPIAWDAYDKTKALYTSLFNIGGVSNLRILDNKFAFARRALQISNRSGTDVFGGFINSVIDNNIFYNMACEYIYLDPKYNGSITRVASGMVATSDERPNIDPMDVELNMTMEALGYSRDIDAGASGYMHHNISISNNKFIYQPDDTPEFYEQAYNYYGTHERATYYPLYTNMAESGFASIPLFFNLGYESSLVIHSTLSGVYSAPGLIDALIFQGYGGAVANPNLLENTSQLFPVNSGSSMTDNVFYGMSGMRTEWIERRAMGYYETQITGLWYPQRATGEDSDDYYSGSYYKTFTSGLEYDSFIALANSGTYWVRNSFNYIQGKKLFAQNVTFDDDGDNESRTAIPLYFNIMMDTDDDVSKPPLFTPSGLINYLDNEDETSGFDGTGNTEVYTSITFLSTDPTNENFLEES